MSKIICSYGSGVEHFLGKEEVVGSSPTMSSIKVLGKDRHDIEDFKVNF